MKKSIYICFVALVVVLLTSCAHTYHYCQICETKPVDEKGIKKQGNGEYQYENTQCIITYNFWSNGGSADFEFYNKTDDIIYIDLAKSFYVKNDVAHDLYGGRQWTQGSSVGIASSVAYDYGGFRSDGVILPNTIMTANVAGISTTTVNEKRIIAIPAHAKKYFKTYQITGGPMISCDLQRYPSRTARQDFSSENSPYRFSDVITYTIGDNTTPVTITNEFYVSAVANYAEPEIVVMKQREEVCENMRDANYVAPERKLYDKVIRDSVCDVSTSFYNLYESTTEKHLYKDDKKRTQTYDYDYDAYVESNPGGNISPLMAGLYAIAVGAMLFVVFLVSNNIF